MERTKQRIQDISARIDSEDIRPLFTFEHHLDIPADRVREALRHKLLYPEISDALWLVGQPVTELASEVDQPYATLRYIINGTEGTSDACLTEEGLVLQGHWWYRGEIRITPQEHGCILQYEVRNIAPKSSRWMVWFMYFSLRKQIRATFAALAQAMQSLS